MMLQTSGDLQRIAKPTVRRSTLEVVEQSCYASGGLVQFGFLSRTSYICVSDRCNAVSVFGLSVQSAAR